MQKGERAEDRIQRRLGPFDTTMIVVSLIIGAGIFRTPSEVALAAGSETLFFAAWLLGGLIATAGALTFAEIGSRHPVAGGYYALVSHAYGPVPAFMLNWVVLVMSGVTAAAVAILAVDYLQPLLADLRFAPDTDARLLGGLVIAGLYAINVAGIRIGAGAQNVLSVLKVITILAVAALGLVWMGDPGADTPSPLSTGQDHSSPNLGTALAMALVPVFFTFGGYQMTMNVSGDVHDPKRNLPRGVLFGVGLVFALYMLINLAYVRVLGFEAVRDSKKVAGDLAAALFGPWGDRAFSSMIALSALGFLNATFLHMPRSYLAMARDGLLPLIFGRVHPRRQVQVFGLTFFTSTTLIGIAFFGEFGEVLNFVMFIDLLAMATLATTLFVLRRRGEGGAETYRVPLYPWLPIAYTGVLFAVVVSVFVNDVFVTRQYHTLGALAILALGYPLARLSRLAVARSGESSRKSKSAG